MAQGHLRSRRRWTMTDVVAASERMRAEKQNGHIDLPLRVQAQEIAARAIALPNQRKQRAAKRMGWNLDPFEPFEFNLPWVPSTNNTYTTRLDNGGRTKVKAARVFQEQAGLMILAQKVPVNRIAHPCCITMVQHCRNEEGDCDNACKLAIDTLVKFGILADDCRKIVKRIVIEDGATEPQPRVVIRIEPWRKP